MVLAQPLNDMQLLGLMAMHSNKGTVTDDVAYAMEILAEVQIQLPGYQKVLADRQRERE
jgi:BarA-like signal transduction histidine kinase